MLLHEHARRAAWVSLERREVVTVRRGTREHAAALVRCKPDDGRAAAPRVALVLARADARADVAEVVVAQPQGVCARVLGVALPLHTGWHGRGQRGRRPGRHEVRRASRRLRRVRLRLHLEARERTARGQVENVDCVVVLHISKNRQDKSSRK